MEQSQRVVDRGTAPPPSAKGEAASAADRARATGAGASEAGGCSARSAWRGYKILRKIAVTHRRSSSEWAEYEANHYSWLKEAGDRGGLEKKSNRACRRRSASESTGGIAIRHWLPS